MLINGIEVGVMGLYYFELNGEPVFPEPSKNLITDFGWTRLSNLSQITTVDTSLGAVCQVGTSNTPPALSDNALGSLLASKIGAGTFVIGTGTDINGDYSYSRIPFAFPQGAVVGNVAEVGFKVANADSGLTSRSLVKDAGGNPAVITVTAIDQLTVQYELRYYRSPLDVTGSVTVAGTPTTYILRTGAPVSGVSDGTNLLAGMNPVVGENILCYGTGSSLGAPGTDPSGTSAGVSVASLVSKTVTVNPTNTVVTFTTQTMAASQGNPAGGVINFRIYPASNNSTNMGSFGGIKANFSPAIPKDNTKTLSISFSFTFSRL